MKPFTFTVELMKCSTFNTVELKENADLWNNFNVTTFTVESINETIYIYSWFYKTFYIYSWINDTFYI